MPNSERPPKISIPIKRIEHLIRIAKVNNLELLEVGHIRIIPRPEPVRLEAQNPLKHESKYEKELKTAMKDGKPLTQRQIEDAILFGPNGVTHEQH